MGKNKLTLILLAGAFVAGAVLGAAGAWGMGLAAKPRAQVLEGMAWVDEGGTALGLSPDGKSAGPGYAVAGAMWREAGGPWHDSFPTCLEPLTLNQRVRLGVVEARSGGQAPDRPVVVWLECLD